MSLEIAARKMLFGSGFILDYKTYFGIDISTTKWEQIFGPLISTAKCSRT